MAFSSFNKILFYLKKYGNAIFLWLKFTLLVLELNCPYLFIDDFSNSEINTKGINSEK